jgi:hypothetical protein
MVAKGGWGDDTVGREDAVVRRCLDVTTDDVVTEVCPHDKTV